MLAAVLVAAALGALSPRHAVAAQPSGPAPAPTPVPSATPAPDICSTGLSAIVSRPTQTTGVCVVKPNHLEIETGYQSETVTAPGTPYTFQTAPNAEIRVGTALGGVELDVFPPNGFRAAAITATSDAGAGIKWQIAASPAFAYGVNVNATVPTGTNPAASSYGFGSANASTYTYNVNVEGTLGPVFTYGATLSENELAAASTGRRYSSFVPSVAIGASLPASTGVVAEIALFGNAAGPGTPVRAQYLLGVTHDFGSRMQADIEGGFSPTAATGRYRFVGAGVSYEF